MKVVRAFASLAKNIHIEIEQQSLHWSWHQSDIQKEYKRIFVFSLYFDFFSLRGSYLKKELI